MRLSRPLFLKWALLNTLAVLLFATLAATYGGEVSGPPLKVALATLLFAVAMTARAGFLAWRIDCRCGPLDYHMADELEDVAYGAYACMILAALGMMVGLFDAVQQGASSTDANAAAHLVLTGFLHGLGATITGVVTSLLLGGEYTYLRKRSRAIRRAERAHR